MKIDNIILIKYCERKELIAIKAAMGTYKSRTTGFFETESQKGVYHDLSLYQVAFIHESDAQRQNGEFYRQAVATAERGDTVVVFFSGGIAQVEAINDRAVLVPNCCIEKYAERFLDAWEKTAGKVRWEGFADGKFNLGTGSAFDRNTTLNPKFIAQILPMHLVAQTHVLLFDDIYKEMRDKLGIAREDAPRRWQNLLENVRNLIPAWEFPEENVQEFADTYKNIRSHLDTVALEEWRKFTDMLTEKYSELVAME